MSEGLTVGEMLSCVSTSEDAEHLLSLKVMLPMHVPQDHAGPLCDPLQLVKVGARQVPTSLLHLYKAH